MRLRTFLSVLFLFALAMFLVELLLPNRDSLEQPMDILGRAVPTWGVILGAFTFGILIGVFFEITGASRGAANRLIAYWSNRHRQAAQRAFERGLQAEREERLEDAIEAYREATQLHPIDYNSQMHLGDALRRAGRPGEAVIAHDRAQRLDLENDEPRQALIDDHLELGSIDEARRLLLLSIEENPRRAFAPLRRLRDLEMRAGQWPAAEAASRKLEGLFDKSKLPLDDWRIGLGIRTELARSRQAAGQPRSAMGIIKKVLKDDPTFVPAVVLDAELHAAAEEFTEARESLIRGFQSTAEPALLDRLTQIDLSRERPEDAISTLRGLVAAGTHTAISRLVLGRLYLRLEMLDEAAQRFEQLYEGDLRSPLVAVLLARTEERRGHFARATRLLQTVVDDSARAIPEAVCRACSAESPRWAARCASCGRFGTVSTSWAITETSGKTQSNPIYPQR
jgi:lipopolysaccharide biosynthesis regulator YciM